MTQSEIYEALIAINAPLENAATSFIDIDDQIIADIVHRAHERLSELMQMIRVEIESKNEPAP